MPFSFYVECRLLPPQVHSHSLASVSELKTAIAVAFDVADAASLVVLFGATALQKDDAFIYEEGIRHGICTPAFLLAGSFRICLFEQIWFWSLFFFFRFLCFSFFNCRQPIAGCGGGATG
jgi:hypothetical protein